MAEHDTPGEAGPWGDPRIDEFYLAATRFLESMRPWVAAGMAEHLAHPRGEPGACRLCAAVDAVADPAEQLLRDATAGLAELGTLVFEELMRLIEELFGRVSLTIEQIRERYTASSSTPADEDDTETEGGVPSDGPGPAVDGAGPGPSGRAARGGRGYVPIEVSVETPRNEEEE
ncbi:hypothetical protein P0W64_16690 [Tsukamurella sp. 8F]|uniref:hypothetical protein n=1 Tax=unclassified Tsukamurella TaxID=2633480 RepID=UPI0023B9EE98|nr:MULTISPECIES: hypothetical protein [unclassified Tsukamurella]MDF0532015.1 hypothetical protein [Tsukamurella sp. 8J]MDF0588420.1 hypothetical protein [Tsukamurella sp. 8F]